MQPQDARVLYTAHEYQYSSYPDPKSRPLNHTSVQDHPASINLNYLKTSSFTAAGSRLIVRNDRRECLSRSDKTTFPEGCSGSAADVPMGSGTSSDEWDNMQSPSGMTLSHPPIGTHGSHPPGWHPSTWALTVLWKRWLSKPPCPAEPKHLILHPKELHDETLASLQT